VTNGSVISCTCRIEFEGLSEYEALDRIYKLMEKGYSIDPKVNLFISEITTTSADGCGIKYSKGEK